MDFRQKGQKGWVNDQTKKKEKKKKKRAKQKEKK